MHRRGLATLGLLAACAAGTAKGADQPAPIPPALIGAWKLSPAESHFPAGRGPRMQYRNFEVTANGALLGHYFSANASGALNAGHWTSPLDGTWSAEYMRSGGATPYAMVRYVPRDALTLEMQATKQGFPFETGRFALALDGKTLTVSFTVGGSTSTGVYHPWNLVD